MRIMCQESTCSLGWVRAFGRMGHDCVVWQPSRKSAFDAFGEFSPNLYVGSTKLLTNAICKCITERPMMRVALAASPWKKGDKPALEAEQERTVIWALKNATGQPEVLFHEGGDASGWETIGCTPLYLPPSADVVGYCGGKPDQLLACDVTFIGDYVKDNRPLNDYIVPLCDPTGSLKVKVFGNALPDLWPVHQWLGAIDNREVANLFQSATVVASLGFNETPFNVLAAGGFCFSGPCPELHEVLKSEALPMVNNPKDFQKSIGVYLKHPERRLSFIQEGKNAVLREHTCFDRIFTLFERLDLADEAENAWTCKDQTLDHYSHPGK